jgi:ribosomal-protein-alanine N-acetyltransferase
MSSRAPHLSTRIRPASRADLLAVFRIEQRAFPQPWPYVAFEQFLGERGFLVAAQAEQVIGYIIADTITNHGRPLGHVKDLAVREADRGHGVGRQLLGSALSAMEAADVARVKLEVRPSNEAAVALYRRFGFSQHRSVPRYYDDGEDALIMIRTG